MITIHQRHRQTDRQTTCDRNTALCTKVHRGVKMQYSQVFAITSAMHYSAENVNLPDLSFVVLLWTYLTSFFLFFGDISFKMCLEMWEGGRPSPSINKQKTSHTILHLKTTVVPVIQERLDNGKVSERLQCVYEGPYGRKLQERNDMRFPVDG